MLVSSKGIARDPLQWAEFCTPSAILEYSEVMASNSGSSSAASASSSRLFPNYQNTLTDSSSKKRYQEKLKLINNVDPYETLREDWTDDVDLWPGTSYINVGMYLLFSPSPYSQEDLENYKSLECYQRFIAGWVRDVLVKSVEDKRIVMAKVSHLCVYFQFIK